MLCGLAALPLTNRRLSGFTPWPQLKLLKPAVFPFHACRRNRTWEGTCRVIGGSALIRITQWSSLARGKVTESLKRVQAVMGRIKYKKREVRAEELCWISKVQRKQKVHCSTAGLCVDVQGQRKARTWTLLDLWSNASPVPVFFCSGTKTPKTPWWNRRLQGPSAPMDSALLMAL